MYCSTKHVNSAMRSLFISSAHRQLVEDYQYQRENSLGWLTPVLHCLLHASNMRSQRGWQQVQSLYVLG